MTDAPIETFASLSAIPWLRHGFLQRVPNLAVNVDRETVISRLRDHHLNAIESIGLGGKILATAEQVHGGRVVRVNANSTYPVADCDGMLTNDPGIALSIYTADCGAIYLVDPVHRAIGLLHSGKKGTELEILTIAVETMSREFGTEAKSLIVQLGPCIRPPHYEIDIAAQIAEQAERAGVSRFFDCGSCTASNSDTYYSYRRELGKTGRMLAVLGYGD